MMWNKWVHLRHWKKRDSLSQLVGSDISHAYVLQNCRTAILGPIHYTTLKKSAATHGCCKRSLMVGRPDLMAAELTVSSNTDPTIINHDTHTTEATYVFTLLKLSHCYESSKNYITLLTNCHSCASSYYIYSKLSEIKLNMWYWSPAILRPLLLIEVLYKKCEAKHHGVYYSGK